MADENVSLGRVQRTIGGGRRTVGTRDALALDWAGGQPASPLLPVKALRAAAGCRFNAVNGNGSTFLAPVTAYPTTTLTMALWNSDVDGGKSLFIDNLYAFLASGTPGVGGALLCCVTKEKQAAPTLSTGDNLGYAGTKISGLSGKHPGSSKGVFINNITALSAPAWMVAAISPNNTATATIATACFFADVQGGIVVPPGHMLGLAVLSAAGTTPLFGFGVTYDEIEADLA